MPRPVQRLRAIRDVEHALDYTRHSPQEDVEPTLVQHLAVSVLREAFLSKRAPAMNEWSVAIVCYGGSTRTDGV